MIQLRWETMANGDKVLRYRTLAFYVDAGGALNVSGEPMWSEWMQAEVLPVTDFNDDLPSEPPASPSIGSRITTERKRMKLRQFQFAELGKVGTASQSNYEANLRTPMADYLLHLAIAGIDVQYIITGIRSANLDIVREHLQEATTDV